MIRVPDVGCHAVDELMPAFASRFRSDGSIIIVIHAAPSTSTGRGRIQDAVKCG